LEETRELVRVRGKRVLFWGKVQRTDQRTRVEPRANPERPSEELNYFGFFSRGEPEPAWRTRGFYEPSLSLDRQD
jgi:hypothetical protein